MCDTFVVLSSDTADGSIIFGKNSDREPNEAQALEYHPAADHPAGSRLQCTYISIPQARRTNAVLLSRPFWMWGAEMGANEKGVVIGNEAVFTRMPYRKQGALTGMDLLRLALERCDTAGAALETIVALLAEHGQGGICGYTNRKLVYHNSYILADPGGAWLLETAGPLWAALKIERRCAISNCLSIGRHFDRAHPELVSTARRRGWLKKGQEFHFTRCYSDWFYTTFSASRARRARSCRLLEQGAMDLRRAFSLLRDHGPQQPYRPDRHLLMKHICAHAGNLQARNDAQSTASLVAHLSDRGCTFWATGTSAPCTGVFKPLRFPARSGGTAERGAAGGAAAALGAAAERAVAAREAATPASGVLPDRGQPPGARYQPDSAWWRHEYLHRLILRDHPALIGLLAAERDALEDRLLEQAGKGELSGWDLSGEAFQAAALAEQQWLERVRAAVEKGIGRPRRAFRRYWNLQNRRAGIEVRY